MLTEQDEQTNVLPIPMNATGAGDSTQNASSKSESRLARVPRIEWLGQTAASLCWIASVFAYGISSNGDWLQLLAASFWLLANIAATLTVQAD